MRWIWPLILLGCGDRASVDTASVCIGGDGETEEPTPVEVEAGQPLTLRADAQFGCHSTDHQVSCSVTEEGPGDFLVHTETTWRRTEPLSLSCESILFTVEAFCETPPLSPGPVTITYAESDLTFEVPGTAEGCLPGLIGG